MLTPEYCELAEAIVQQSQEVHKSCWTVMGFRTPSTWRWIPGVCLADGADHALTEPDNPWTEPPRRLVQTFSLQEHV